MSVSASATIDDQARYRRTAVTGWYGDNTRELDIASGTALWYHPGLPPLPLRWVLVRDVTGEHEPQAFLCTDAAAEPVDMLRLFVRRWSMEVTFAEVRRHLGVETQRQWSDKAVARTTPSLMALFSLVTVWATQLSAHGLLLPRQAAWYPKRDLTFSDALAAVRRQLWIAQLSSTSPTSAEIANIPLAVLERLTNAACYPA